VLTSPPYSSRRSLAGATEQDKKLDANLELPIAGRSFHPPKNGKMPYPETYSKYRVDDNCPQTEMPIDWFHFISLDVLFGVR
jgi:hypothetical protein